MLMALSLLAATAAQPADFTPLAILENDSAHVIVQMGKFDCPGDDAHRVVLMVPGNYVMLGCGLFDKDHTALSVTWESGAKFLIRIQKPKQLGPLDKEASKEVF